MGARREGRDGDRRRPRLCRATALLLRAKAHRSWSAPARATKSRPSRQRRRASSGSWAVSRTRRSSSGWSARPSRASGRLDVLVNNAAILGRRPFLDLEPALWDEVMAVNLRGAYLCSRAPPFSRWPWQQPVGGSIVNVASLSGVRGPEKFRRPGRLQRLEGWPAGPDRHPGRRGQAARHPGQRRLAGRRRDPRCCGRPATASGAGHPRRRRPHDPVPGQRRLAADDRRKPGDPLERIVLAPARRFR